MTKQRNAHHTPMAGPTTAISNPPTGQIAHQKWADEILTQPSIKIPSGDKTWLMKYALSHIPFTLENRDLFRWMVQKYWKGHLKLNPGQIDRIKKYENQDKPKPINSFFVR